MPVQYDQSDGSLDGLLRLRRQLIADKQHVTSTDLATNTRVYTLAFNGGKGKPRLTHSGLFTAEGGRTDFGQQVNLLLDGKREPTSLLAVATGLELAEDGMTLCITSLGGLDVFDDRPEPERLAHPL